MCAPDELLYWTQDLEGCSFEQSSSTVDDTTLRIEEMVTTMGGDEKDDKDDDPNMTWTSAISTKG